MISPLEVYSPRATSASSSSYWLRDIRTLSVTVRGDMVIDSVTGVAQYTVFDNMRNTFRSERIKNHNNDTSAAQRFYDAVATVLKEKGGKVGSKIWAVRRIPRYPTISDGDPSREDVFQVVAAPPAAAPHPRFLPVPKHLIAH